METISADTIEKTLPKMDKMSLSDVKKMMDLMGEEQPYVLAYLMAIGGESLNLDERELLVYLGTVVWQIMSKGSSLSPPELGLSASQEVPISQISGETLDTYEAKNWQMLEYLQGESDSDFVDTVEKIFENYPQPEVLKYVIEALMTEAEEGDAIREKNIGLMAIYLKTIIDCFNT